MLPAWEPATQETSQYFQTIRDNPDKLRIFFRDMPLGGDIHHHLSGSVWAEDLIEIALRYELCTDNTWFLTLPPCANGSQPFQSKNPAQYVSAIDAWSMQGQKPGSKDASRHFYSIFSKIGYAATRTVDVLPQLMRRASLEGVTYLETMTRAREARETLADLEKQWTWRSDWDGFTKELQRDPLYQKSLNLALSAFDRYHQNLGPISGETGVEVRFIYQIHRHQEKTRVFISTALAFEIADRSPHVVGVTMVGPETHYYSQVEYETHMSMLAFFHKKYPQVRQTLHAGETQPGMAPPEKRSHHIRDAIETAGAERIGHGIDIAAETDAPGLLQKMADEKLAVEIAPSSNEWLLGITQPHPMQLYWESGVPLVLATDDAGIFRTDLTEQFVLATLRNPDLRYEHFKEMVRNSLEFSFLEGNSLWLKRGVYTEMAAMAEKRDQFLAENTRARLQWRLENDFKEFEARF